MVGSGGTETQRGVRPQTMFIQEQFRSAAVIGASGQLGSEFANENICLLNELTCTVGLGHGSP